MQRSSSIAEQFLQNYNSVYEILASEFLLARWNYFTDINNTDPAIWEIMGRALEKFQGSKAVLDTFTFLDDSEELCEKDIRQVQKIMIAAGEAPQSKPNLTIKKQELHNIQIQNYSKYQYSFQGNEVQKSMLLSVLKKSTDIKEREEAWNSLSRVSSSLFNNLDELRHARNTLAKEVDFPSYLDLQCADYGKTADEMYDWLQGMCNTVKPAYDQLFYKLEKNIQERFEVTTNGNLDIHLLQNPWGQKWPELNVTESELDTQIEKKGSEWIVESGLDFWSSLGLGSLDQEFISNSDFYKKNETDSRKKLGGASTWHINLDNDIRSLMNIEPNLNWFGSLHHELGHAYYYRAYSNKNVPVILRSGFCRAAQEAVGDLIRIASRQPRYLKRLGIQTSETDYEASLLAEATNLALPLFMFSAGSMFDLEYAIYSEETPVHLLQDRWWGAVKKYQNLMPTSNRPNTQCDAFTKRHLTFSPGYYFNYGLSVAMSYQIYEHICCKILNQDPNDADFYGEKKVGDFLYDFMQLGATEPWDKTYRKMVGEDLSVEPMLRRFSKVLN